MEASDHSCVLFGFKRSTRKPLILNSLSPLFEFLPAQGSLESRGYIPLSSISLVVLFMLSYVDSLRCSFILVYFQFPGNGFRLFSSCVKCMTLWCWNALVFAAYMPHLSLLYGDLTEEEKKTALEKACALDDSIGGLSFQISRLALYKTETEDTSCKSWEKVEEFELKPWLLGTSYWA